MLFPLQKLECQLSSCKQSAAMFPILSSVGVCCKAIMWKADIKQGLDLSVGKHPVSLFRSEIQGWQEFLVVNVYFCLRHPINVPRKMQDLWYSFTSSGHSQIPSLDLWQWHIFTCRHKVPLQISPVLTFLVDSLILQFYNLVQSWKHSPAISKVVDIENIQSCIELTKYYKYTCLWKQICLA